MLGDCTDFGCAVSDSGGTAKDSADGSAESPQLKRRRMLHCNHDDPVEIICAGPSSEFLNPRWVNGRDRDAVGHGPGGHTGLGSDDILGALGESSKCWLESCFNESEMLWVPGTAKDSADGSDNPRPRSSGWSRERLPHSVGTCGSTALRRASLRAPQPFSPSYTKFPTTTASTVAYPFTLIKPCGDRGEVTLEEINQILRTVRRPE
ncbi:unnamed protein product [Spirodela intermedia]|uniref:Uncharacterized protein n=1 Tax=Spirodela intermedia TaxID=51605 RepID=A0A7I8JDJ6_SPIIN|nr:unnamed protein product [Spirodela intermedia]CAA6668159.1 unnamed protein product [Spirodela intermedia]